MKTWQEIILGAFIGLLLAGLLFLLLEPRRGSSVVLDPIPTIAPLVIDISGAIQTPGSYSLPAGSRVSSAIQAAGGLTTNADTSLVNLAATLTDGERIWIPQAATSTPQISVTATLNPPSSTNPVNINTATEAELDALPGIGPVKANAIIVYRQQNGLFSSINDLKNVPGISESLFEAIQSLITVQPSG